ncbi:MAG: type II toxin-antitoxin system RelE/ParE family toxin [Elusimicrobia bacterium]|nr:type II toxin-antitoxin system RelE/ParE family toxin [Elusimicrobiota bacterium]
MKYRIELMPVAVRDLKKIPVAEVRKIVKKLKLLENNLRGDIKKLTNYTQEYRLRIGKWRVLFEIEGKRIIVYRIIQRKNAYRKGG